jgi:hypothetical protein
MFGQSNNKKKKDENEGLAVKSARGNMDEYEALRTIIAENAGLLARVLEKIKVHRALSAEPAPTGLKNTEKTKKVK